MKFLIIRFSSIGDIVLTTPVVRCLKKQVATAEIHYLTKTDFRSIIDANPFIDRAHYLHDNFEELMDVLRREDFDYVIDLHHNVRTLKVKKSLGKQAFSFNKLNVEKWLYTSFKWNRMPDAHIVDRYLETVQAFGVRNDGAGLDYFIPEQDRVKESDIPASHHAGYVAIVIGAAVNTKKYPQEKLSALCATLPHPVILLGGPEDAPAGQVICEADPVKIYNACGRFSLNESADLVRRAKLVVSNDTGLMHIASAFKRPVISLWGNTVPEFGMYPYYGQNYLDATSAGGKPYDAIEVKNLSCRPCSKIGYKKCPRGHFKCMQNIAPETVLERINNRILKKQNG